MKPSEKAIARAANMLWNTGGARSFVERALEAVYVIDVDPLEQQIAEQADAIRQWNLILADKALTIAEQVAEISFLKRNSESLDTVLDEQNKEIEQLMDDLIEHKRVRSALEAENNDKDAFIASVFDLVNTRCRETISAFTGVETKEGIDRLADHCVKLKQENQLLKERTK
jgi:galactose-1-phosphate uridylyltransferase